MPTPLYRFHCTDGHELIADTRGKRLPTLALVLTHADRLACDLMAKGGRRDWSGWVVEIYDANGRHLMSRTFADVMARAGGRTERVHVSC